MFKLPSLIQPDQKWYAVLALKSCWSASRGRLGYRWGEDVKFDFKIIACECAHWILVLSEMHHLKRNQFTLAQCQPMKEPAAEAVTLRDLQCETKLYT
jgi:hypothetical protein